MDSAVPDVGGPRSDPPLQRSFTPAQKVEYVAAYEAACQTHRGGAYLRSEGLFSSQITEWRKLRDAGVLTGRTSGERVPKPSAEQPGSPGSAVSWNGPSCGWRRPRRHW